MAETPESVGVSSAALERLYAAASEEVTSGRLAGCAVAVARNGRLAGTAAFGTTSNGAATESTLFHIFSSTKAIMGVAMAQLLEEGRLTLETKVSDIIPGWGANGKEGVTIRHLVTFSAVTPRSFHPTTTPLPPPKPAALSEACGWPAQGFPSPHPAVDNSLPESAELMGTSEARTAQFATWELAPEWGGEPGSFWMCKRARQCTLSPWLLPSCPCSTRPIPEV